MLKKRKIPGKKKFFPRREKIVLNSPDETRRLAETRHPAERASRACAWLVHVEAGTATQYSPPPPAYTNNRPTTWRQNLEPSLPHTHTHTHTHTNTHTRPQPDISKGGQKASRYCNQPTPLPHTLDQMLWAAERARGGLKYS